MGVFVTNNLLNFYAKTGLGGDAHQLFDEMPVKNTSTWNILISSQMKQGSITAASILFKKIPHPDSVSWTSMMAGYNGAGYFGHALKVFVEMLWSRVMPSHFTLTNILSSCASLRSLPTGRKVHCFVIKLGFSGFVPVLNSLLNMYSKTGEIRTAEVVFDRMPAKNTSSWNTMISLLLRSGRPHLARNMFDDMPEKDTVSWNSIISGYCQCGFEAHALHMFAEMLGSSFRPDRFSLASILSACANSGDQETGKRIHSIVIRTNFDSCEPVRNALISMYSKTGSVETAEKAIKCCTTATDINVVAFTSLLDGYIKRGDVSPARGVFDSIKNRDVVAWTAMIVGYVQNGLYAQAEELFRMMIGDGVEPNGHTLSAVLSLCSAVASLSHGKQVHAFALRRGEYASSTSVGNALINMYSKSGCIEGARTMFGLVQWKRDAVSWSSMILALAHHGIGESAVELFEEMIDKGVKPDHITYVGLLCACTHAGLVERGRSYYKMMQDVHKIKPTSSHCACMVDLLSRAGRLGEAREFIENMPVEPDVVVWGSLLASCRLHKNIQVADFAAEKLLLIEPDHSGVYSALAGVYASCRRWDAAAEIRKVMRERHVKKEQGFSWVQIKDRVHVFGADDISHPQREKIYDTMDGIWGGIKKMGFRPDVDSVLHDLDGEVKEQILMHHSEKLAIAFGLMSTPENTTLRIMKNLRVCNDCHNAIKFISKLVRREIIVRDATRFHHFKDASCSCRDYW